MEFNFQDRTLAGRIIAARLSETNDGMPTSRKTDPRSHYNLNRPRKARRVAKGIGTFLMFMVVLALAGFIWIATQ